MVVALSWWRSRVHRELQQNPGHRFLCNEFRNLRRDDGLGMPPSFNVKYLPVHVECEGWATRRPRVEHRTVCRSRETGVTKRRFVSAPSHGKIFITESTEGTEA